MEPMLRWDGNRFFITEISGIGGENIFSKKAPTFRTMRVSSHGSGRSSRPGVRMAASSGRLSGDAFREVPCSSRS